MEIINRKISEINPAKYNPRQITDQELSGLKESLKKFGFVEPLIVNKRTNTLCGGHQRLKAAESIGFVEVPIVEVDLSLSEEKALNVALNSHTISGNFDNDILKDLLSEIKMEMPDLFSNLNMDSMLPDIAVEILPSEGLTDPDDVPELPSDPITKRGDVWILGNHRLMCGDSTMIDNVDKLMNGEKAQIAFTSPPYNAGDEVELGSKGHKYETHDDNMESDSYLQLLKDFTTNTLMFCDISIVNIQQLSGNKIAFIEYLEYFKNQLVDVGIWNKTYGTPCLPKRCMNSAFEYVLFFSHEQNPPKTIKTAPMFHGSINNVYSGDKQTKNEFSKIHRATFPVHLPEYYISNFSTGSVIELFNGCGTTIIACEKLGRKCFAMEMDPLYVDTTINRWEKFTGKKAVLENGDRKVIQVEQNINMSQLL